MRAGCCLWVAAALLQQDAERCAEDAEGLFKTAVVVTAHFPDCTDRDGTEPAKAIVYKKEIGGSRVADVKALADGLLCDVTGISLCLVGKLCRHSAANRQYHLRIRGAEPDDAATLKSLGKPLAFDLHPVEELPVRVYVYAPEQDRSEEFALPLEDFQRLTGAELKRRIDTAASAATETPAAATYFLMSWRGGYLQDGARLDSPLSVRGGLLSGALRGVRAGDVLTVAAGTREQRQQQEQQQPPPPPVSAGDPKGYYRILGVSPGADAGAIRKAYLRASMRLHPDKSAAPDATQQFARLAEAYDVLSDPAARAAY